MTLPVVLTVLVVTAPVVPTPSPGLTVPEPAVRLQELTEAAWEDYLELHPRLATQVGDHRFDHLFGDGISNEWRSRMARLARDTIAAARKIEPDGLPGDEERLTRRLLIAWMESELEGLAYPEHLLAVSHLPSSPPVAFGQELAGAGPFRFRGAADFDAFLSRMHGFASWVDTAVTALAAGAERGVVPPCAVVRATVAQLDRHLPQDLRASRFTAPLAYLPSDLAPRERARIEAAWLGTLREVVVPAYRRLRRAVAEVAAPACRETLSMRSLPDGSRWYRMRVRRFTTTDMSPVELFQLGLEECRRIRTELEVLERRELDGSRTPAPLRGESQVLEAYERIRRRVGRRLGIAFGTLPETGLRIVPMNEVLAASGAAAFYQPPPPGSGRQGMFLVDASRSTYPDRGMEALFLHEALPGHHLQLSLAAENGSLPAFRRHLYQGAFIEGWALYAEGLGGLLGLYLDPVQEAGRLEQQLRRAARLVADVGIHGLGWSREQVAKALRDVARGVNLDELDRYAAIPGQGLAYTVGERTFVRLRERAHEELGGAFDLRAFHDEVLRHGALPLPVLEDVVERWIEERRPSPTAASDGPRTPPPAQGGGGDEPVPGGESGPTVTRPDAPSSSGREPSRHSQS